MNIAHRIREEGFQFESVHGAKPTRLYIGRNEWEQLKEYAYATFEIVVCRVGEAEYRGMAILRVDRADHLEVT